MLVCAKKRERSQERVRFPARRTREGGKKLRKRELES